MNDSSDDITLGELDSLSTKPPPPDDVHNKSTIVAELSETLLDSLKVPSARRTVASDLDDLPLLDEEEGDQAHDDDQDVVVEIVVDDAPSSPPEPAIEARRAPASVTIGFLLIALPLVVLGLWIVAVLLGVLR